MLPSPSVASKYAFQNFVQDSALPGETGAAALGTPMGAEPINE